MSISLPALTSAKGGKESNRRLAVLNTLFMEQITDLIATGKFSEELVGHGIQISCVKVTNDFHAINIFWSVRDNRNDIEISKMLKRVSGDLRHELAQLRLIGQVPRLNFVKDKTYCIFTNSALQNADYGKAFTTKDPTSLIGSDVKLHVDLPRVVRKNIDELVDKSYFLTDNQDSLPNMRHDVLGLDHFAIMHKIKRLLMKSKITWAQYGHDINRK
ncbi:uncharacterized protein LOC131683260 isoform X2 [Topomyia yanbarensis]|nr:uncharacterized protein LOC131683260 isoform X2 [Topomyia yanbarensis]